MPTRIINFLCSSGNYSRKSEGKLVSKGGPLLSNDKWLL